MVISEKDLQTPVARPILSEILQIRLTENQANLLREVARISGRPMSAIVRDVIVMWATRQLDPDDVGLTQEEHGVDVLRLVEELEQLGDTE